MKRERLFKPTYTLWRTLYKAVAICLIAVTLAGLIPSPLVRSVAPALADLLPPASVALAQSTNLIGLKEVNTTTPAAGETFYYTIKYRCASITAAYCANTTIVDTVPAPLEIVDYTKVGGNVKAVSLSGNTLTWTLGTPVNALPPGVPVGELATGSTGILKIAVRFPTCGVTAPPASVTNTAALSADGLSADQSAPAVTTPAGISAVCPIDPVPPTVGFSKVNYYNVSAVGLGGNIAYQINLPSSTIGYVVTETLPSGMQVGGNTIQPTGQPDAWPKSMEVDCTDDGVANFFEISTQANFHFNNWFEVNIANMSNLLDKNGNPTGCVGSLIYPTADPTLSTSYKANAHQIRYTVPPIPTYSGNRSSLVNLYADATGVGPIISNCAVSSEHGPTCAPNAVNIGTAPYLAPDKNLAVLGTQPNGLPEYTGGSKYLPLEDVPPTQPNDLVYFATVAADPIGGADVNDPYIEDILPAELDYVTGVDGNWWRMLWGTTPNGTGLADPSLSPINQAACQNPTFTRTVQPDGRIKLRWEWPGCLLPRTNWSLPIGVWFSARIKPGVVAGTNIRNRIQVGSLQVSSVFCGTNQPGVTTLTDTCYSYPVDYIVPEMTDLNSVKWVQGALDPSYHRYPNSGMTNLAGDGTYIVEIAHSGNVTNTQLDVVDILPWIGDKALVTLANRLSQWSAEIDLPITVQRISADGTTTTTVPAGELPLGIEYSTNTNLCYLDNELIPNITADSTVASNPSGCTSANWTGTAAGARAFALRWSPVIPFSSGEKLRITVPVRQLTGEADAGNQQIAWNSFAYSARYWDSKTNSLQTLLSTEPPKVGLAMIQTAETAALGDYVWFDSNANGLQESGETPIAGVTVHLYDGASLVLTTTTDATGYYAFWGLTPNHAYTVKLDNPSDFVAGAPLGGLKLTLTNVNDPTDDARDNDASLVGGYPTIANATTGAADTFVPTYDFGFTILSALGDKVWYDDNHDGAQDASELGVPGVTVTLKNAAGATISTTTTSAAGTYLFDNLTPGDYYVVFSNLPISYTYTLPDASGDDATDSDPDATGRTVLTNLAPGERDLTWDAGIYLLPPPPATPATIGNRVWYDNNHDGIQDGDAAGETGVAGVRVTLLDAAGFPLEALITDATGYYTFTNLAPGSYAVKFDLTTLPVDYLPTIQGPSGSSDPTDSDANPATGETEQTTLGPNEVDPTWDLGIWTVQPEIVLKKYTNGHDADLVPGPTLKPGDVVTWTYNITNTGNVTLTNIRLVDDKEGTITCTPTTLAPGVATTCVQTGIAVLGQYSNTAIVTGTPTMGPVTPVTSTNPSHYNAVGLSLGNRLWIDSGAGTAANRNNGSYDTGEPAVPQGVVVELLNTTGTVLLTTTTDSNGYYRFDNLPEDQYQVRIPASEFATGGKLYGYLSSTGQTTTFAAGNNNQDHGDDTVTDGVTSSIITLSTTNPLGEVDGGATGAGANGPTGDANDNLTVDFGFVLLQTGTIVVRKVTPTHVVNNCAEVTASDTADPNSTPNNGVNNGENDASCAPVTVSVDTAGVNFAFVDNILTVNGVTTPTFTLTSGSQVQFNQVISGVYTITETGAAGWQLAGTNCSNGSTPGSISVTAGMTVTCIFTNTQVSTYSLGNRLWIDDGAGTLANRDNGRYDSGEQPVPQGVIVELLNITGTVVATTTTDLAGYYRFDDLDAGDYRVRIPASEFLAGGKLFGYLSSTGVTNTFTTGDNNVDHGDDNVSNGVQSAIVTLGPINPTSEVEVGATGAGANGPTGDANDNLTVDFGFVQPVAQFGDRVWIESDNDGLANTGVITPVAGMLITATTGGQVYTTTTNALGYYSFTVPGNLTYTVHYGAVPAVYGAVIPSATPGGNHEQGNAGVYAESGNPDRSHTQDTTVFVQPGEANWLTDFAFWLPKPRIYLKKYTNGHDADTPSGPTLKPGDVVTWTYDITNTGNVTLTNIRLVDDKEGTIACTPTTLVPGAATTCVQTGIAKAGQYSNTAIVTGTPTLGPVTPVTSTNPSHYNAPVAQFGDRVWIESDNDGVVATGIITPVAGMLITATDGVDVYTTTTNALGYYSFTVPANLTYTVHYGAVPAIYGSVLPSATPGGNHEQGNAGVYAESGNPDRSHTQDTTVFVQDDEANWLIDFAFWTPQPEIVLKKYTNGEDADIPTGPTVAVGGVVTWTYDITNTGNVTLTNVRLVDDKEGSITCPQSQLVPGAYMTCILTGIAKLGQYANTAVVTGTPTLGPVTPVTSTNPSHYVGVEAGLGDRVWYDDNRNGVQDPGETGVSNVTVHLLNSSGTVISTTATSATGYYSFTNLAPGQYSVRFVIDTLPNGYELTSQDRGGDDAADSDANPTTGETILTTLMDNEYDPTWDAGIWRAQPEIVLKKYTNGYDADLPTGPALKLGSVVTWTYNLTNTGNVTLTNITLVDNVEGTITCTPTTLSPGAGTSCTQTGIARAGQYANTAVVTGTPTLGPVTPVTSTDPSHYFGVDPQIALKKYTNGWDADTVTGPQVLVGSVVTWTYIMTNTGNITLTDITLVDDKEGGITCPVTSLAPSATTTCLKLGIARIGQYTNTAVVTGTPVLPPVLPPDLPEFPIVPPPTTPVTDTDPSHYYALGLSLGNRLWRDTGAGTAANYNNGVYDAGEPAVPQGVVVELLDAAGKLLRTTTTDSNGYYRFDNLPAGQYQVRIPASEFAAGGKLYGYLSSTGQTTTFAVGDNNHDHGDDTVTDGVTSTIITLNTTNPLGEVDSGSTGAGANGPDGDANDNLTVDFGFYQLAGLGDRVWFDNNMNGLQDPGEEGVQNVVVNLYSLNGDLLDTTTTNAEGNYQFLNLPPGQYYVGFILPTDYEISPQHVGGDDTNDSDVNVSTGYTQLLLIGPGEYIPDLDAGIFRSPASLGEDSEPLQGNRLYLPIVSR